MRSELKIDGMTCAACSGRIERVLAKTNGIEEINVNLTTETATVSFDQTLITNDEIINKIEKSGHEETLYEFQATRQSFPKSEGWLIL